MPQESPQQSLGRRRRRLGKIDKNDNAGANADSEGHATDHAVCPNTLVPQESSHQTLQTQEEILEFTPTEELTATPHKKLAPGLTVHTHDTLITVVNSVRGTLPALEIGDTAAQLLRNAQKAEQLLYKVSHASEQEVAQGWDPAKATAALEAVDAAKTLKPAHKPTNTDHN